MPERTPHHIRNHPMAGDVIEIRERRTDDHDGTEFDCEVMLRIIAVHEDRVWFKEYGKGHRLVTLKEFQDRFGKSSVQKKIRGADQDCPF